MVNASMTLREIVDQPRVWRETLAAASAERMPRLPLSGMDGVYFVGSGSSYYLSMVLAHRLRPLIPGAVEALPSVEVLLHPEAYFQPGRKYLTIVVSRSGNSTEVVRAAGALKEAGRSEVVALSCTADSPLVALGDYALVAPVREESIVMTQSFTAMALLFEAALRQSLAVDGGQAGLKLAIPGLEELRRGAAPLAEACANLVQKHRGEVEALASRADLDHFVLLGSGLRYGIAREGALKLHEMALARTEAYHTLEYRHGPQSTAGQRTLAVTLVGPGEEGWLAPLVKDLDGLGATQIVLSSQGRVPVPNGATIALEEVGDEFAQALLMLALLQVMAERRAVSQGLDPDRPRHLSKVVVLEE